MRKLFDVVVLICLMIMAMPFAVIIMIFKIALEIANATIKDLINE